MSLASLETDLTKALTESFPPLARYVPEDILSQISAPQAAFLLADDRELLYGGSAGGGKSAALLMGALQYVDVSGYRAAILRRTFAQLTKGDALIPLSHEWLAATDARWNEQKKTWTFPSGATVEFGHVENESSKYDYQGAAFHYVGFDELTQFSETQYTYIAFSRQRRRTKFVDLGIPVRVRSASNPGGLGHGWVMKRFLGGKTQHRVYRGPADEHGGPGPLFIPARVRDNPGLDADDYERSLGHLSVELRKQLMDGDWEAFEGMAYPEFDTELHIVPPMEIPDAWQRFESMDHGIDAPTAWLWYAVDYDGNVVVYDEYYKPGLPDDHARVVLEKRRLAGARDEEGKLRSVVCYGDPSSIREKLGVKDAYGQPMTLQDEYLRWGVWIIPGNNRRQSGYARVRTLIKPQPERRFPGWHERAGDKGAPQLFVVRDRCPNLVEQIAAAPVASDEFDPERGNAVDKKWESANGHAHASARYGLLTWFQTSKEPEPEPTDPRERAVVELRKRHRERLERFGRDEYETIGL